MNSPVDACNCTKVCGDSADAEPGAYFVKTSNFFVQNKDPGGKLHYCSQVCENFYDFEVFFLKLCDQQRHTELPNTVSLPSKPTIISAKS